MRFMASNPWNDQATAPIFFFSLSERAEQQEMADPQQDFSSPPQPCPQPCSSPQRMQSCKLKGPLPVNRRVHREVGCSLQTSGRKEKKREKKKPSSAWRARSEKDPVVASKLTISPVEGRKTLKQIVSNSFDLP